MSKNNNNKNNNQENIFFKNSNINIKDYIPNNIKDNNIREQIPLKYEDISERNYPFELYPNCPFEKWPSNEEIKSYDFNVNSDIEFNDPNNNLLILPYSLRKDSFDSIKWMRPKEYIKQKKLIKRIKDVFPNKNFNFIKNKFSIAFNNILNFKTYNKNDDDSESESNSIAEKVNNEDKNYENEKEGFNSIDNLKVEIKKGNSIDLGIAYGEGSNYSKDFINSKLSKKEKEIFEESEKNQKFNFYIVNTEIIENNDDKIDKKKSFNKNKNLVKETDIKYNIKLLPKSLSLHIGLSEYSRWISSLFQLILDNNIYTENNSNHFLRRIYPQDENGTPIYNPSGKYWVKLYHMGEERKIEIDDKFPVNIFTYEPIFPQCESEYELWPLILTKSLIKLFSYKYHSDYYEYNEIGDNSILYSLIQYIGIQLPVNKFYTFLNNIQSINNEKKIGEDDYDENNIDNKNKIEEITLLKNNNNFNYDLLIGIYKSNNKIISNKEKKSQILYNSNSKPIISRNQRLLYLPLISEKIIKIKEKNHFNTSLVKSKKRKSIIINEIHKKNIISNNALSPSRVTDFSNKFNFYNRFNTGEGSKLYSNSQKYLISKTNRILNNGIICDVGYSILELFNNHHFNMKRTKPLLFNDLKLNIDKKYKQMDPEEKVIYIEKIKELRLKQKKEKKIRINEYINIGYNIMFIRVFNGINTSNKEKTELKFDSGVTSNEIKAAKFCIENKTPFPPEKYYEKGFLEKVFKDEETGEINFWTKCFYHKLLKKYFKEKIIKEENKLNINSNQDIQNSNINIESNNELENDDMKKIEE